MDLNQTKIIISLREPKGETRTLATNMVLDVDQFGEITGLEVLGFGSTVGVSDTISEEVNNMRLSYDEDADAFYLKIAEGGSLNQYFVEGNLVMDSTSQLVQVEFEPSKGLPEADPALKSLVKIWERL